MIQKEKKRRLKNRTLNIHTHTRAQINVAEFVCFVFLYNLNKVWAHKTVKNKEEKNVDVHRKKNTHYYCCCEEISHKNITAKEKKQTNKQKLFVDFQWE